MIMTCISTLQLHDQIRLTVMRLASLKKILKIPFDNVFEGFYNEVCVHFLLDRAIWSGLIALFVPS
jgi:hypothetical protein